jgi:hypothetical protein
MGRDEARLSAEESREAFEDQTTKNDEAEDGCRDKISQVLHDKPAREVAGRRFTLPLGLPGGRLHKGGCRGDRLELGTVWRNLPSQKGEMGDLETSLVRFLSCSSDLPMRASCSFANLALRRRCSGVWACRFPQSINLELLLNGTTGR